MKLFPTLTQPATYRIRISGYVSNGWPDYMNGLQVKHIMENGTSVTEFVGIVVDQSALFGLLIHIRDLGFPLISVEFIEKPKGE